MSKLVRFDWAIKYLLRDKANFDILEGFLSAVIGEDIQVQELLESEGNQAHEKDKYNRVDLLVKDTKGELIFIEIQVEAEQDFFQRLAYGTSKLIVQYMEKGKPYSDIKKVISVSVAYFSLGEGQDYIYHGTTNFTGMNKKDKLKLTEWQQKLYGTSDVYGLFPEYYLLRVEEFDDHISDDRDEWLYMLKHDDVEPDFHAKHIQDAGERLQYLSLNKKKRQEYERYLENLRYRASMEESHRVKAEERFEQGVQQGIEKGIEKGIEQGMEKGIEKERIAIARNALAAGMAVSQIIKITSLSEERINQLEDAEH